MMTRLEELCAELAEHSKRERHAARLYDKSEDGTAAKQHARAMLADLNSIRLRLENEIDAEFEKEEAATG